MMTLQEAIKAAILLDEGKLLKPKFRKEWKESNYQRGYCYLVSEVLYHFVPQFKDFTPRIMHISPDETHWFKKKKKTGEIADYTSAQYQFMLEYTLSTKKAFLNGSVKTSRGYASKKSVKLYNFIRKNELWTQLESTH